jgi:hypothetical protein
MNSLDVPMKVDQPGYNLSHEPNDHHIFQSADGKWHLWACVRNTGVGRLLYHYQADSLAQSPWVETGEYIRANRSYGESLVEWYGMEFLQSPYIVQKENIFFMFYGGYDTGIDTAGNPVNPAENYDCAEKQICLMTSANGYQWKRYRNDKGNSRVFMGPGAARDECVVKGDSLWYCYYTGHMDCDREKQAIFVRTSRDLYHWSVPHLAHYKKSYKKCESPCVVRKEGYYYMILSNGSPLGEPVFCSDDPMVFDGKPVNYIHAHACEIIRDEQGNEYISKIFQRRQQGPPEYGIRLARLSWKKIP